MQQTLSSLEFEKYFHLLRDALANKVEGFAICDSQNTVLWSKLSIEKDNLEEAIKLSDLLDKKHSTSGTNINVQTLDLPDKKIVYCVKLYDEAEESLGFLLVKLSTHKLNAEHSPLASAASLINHIAECIQREYKLTSELNSMANELAERYDELNLLYTTDDDIHNVNELHHLLKQLVKNCADYLDVEVAALIIPDKAITITHSTSVNANVELSALIDKLKNVIYKKLIINKASIVINNNADAADICADVTCKALASPITNSDGQVMGALMIMKDQSRVDYSNSDRNLLEVMSMKVSKIIQENYDALTGLLNRSGYEEKVAEYLLLSHEKGLSHCVLNIDVDNFQVVNETSGYQVGNELIHQIADIIKEHVRDSDIVARTGGDEFSVLLDNCPIEKAASIAEQIRLAVSSKQFSVNEQLLKLTTSIGVVPITKDSESVASILSSVEVACATAKEMGKNNVQTYKKEILDRKKEMKWVSRIQTALQTNKFQLYCQTIEPLQGSGETLNIEILLRLKDEDGKILTPWSFLPAAERFYLMPEIDKWVITETLKIFSDYWPKLNNPHGKIAINLSGQSLGTKNFLDFVVDHTSKALLPAENICFEVTESAAISNLENAIHFMSELRNKGFLFSLDDFGTGLSSFSYLKTLNVDYLKIDGSFVKEIINDPIAETMVAAINHVGHVMGLKTIAEFVENDDIKDRLKGMCVDYVQGYAITKPIPLTEYLDQFLKQQNETYETLNSAR